MTAINHQTQGIIDYVKAFLSQATTEDADMDTIMQQWMSPDNIADVGALLKRSAPKRSTGTKLKDPNKPKRGRSAYIQFCADERPAAKAALDDPKPTEVTAELGRRWNVLKDSKKSADKKRHAKYVEAAVVDKQRYNDEMGAYSEPSEAELELLTVNKPKRGRKSTKKPTEEGKPKRGRSAYIFYCQATRPAIKEEMADAKATEVTAELGARWSALKALVDGGDAGSCAEYEAYAAMAVDDKARHETETAAWVATKGDDVDRAAPKIKKAKKAPSGDDVDKAAPKIKAKKTPVIAEDVYDNEGDDTEEDTDIEDDTVVPEPPKRQRKLPEFVTAAKTAKKPTVKDPGFAAFAEQQEKDARAGLGKKATDAAIKRQLLKEWTALTAEDRAWYAE
jgi:hypothetical protein